MIRDGLPIDLDPRVRVLLDDPGQPLVMVRLFWGRCGCSLGAVVKVRGINVLHVTRVTALQGLEGMERRHQEAAVLLDDPDRPVDAGCKHAPGQLVPLTTIREAVFRVEAGVLRRGAPVVCRDVGYRGQITPAG